MEPPRNLDTCAPRSTNKGDDIAYVVVAAGQAEVTSQKSDGVLPGGRKGEVDLIYADGRGCGPRPMIINESLVDPAGDSGRPQRIFPHL